MSPALSGTGPLIAKAHTTKGQSLPQQPGVDSSNLLHIILSLTLLPCIATFLMIKQKGKKLKKFSQTMPAKCPQQDNGTPWWRDQLFRPVPISWCAPHMPHTCTRPIDENRVKDDSSVYITFSPHLCRPLPMVFHHGTFKCARIALQPYNNICLRTVIVNELFLLTQPETANAVRDQPHEGIGCSLLSIT